jgi:Tfp pilus assembly protein PilX
MALLILLVLTILGTAVISLSSLEKKISSYSYRDMKAREAADAGVEWAMELTQKNLNDANPSTGPAGSPDGSPAVPIVLGSGTEQVSWEIIYTSGIPVPGNNYSYNFRAQGTCSRGTPQEVSRTVAVSALFVCAGGTYQQGSIKSYELKNN